MIKQKRKEKLHIKTQIGLSVILFCF